MSTKSNNLLKIYSRLKRGPVTIEIIKQWARKNGINISERTFYRYMDDLENLMLENEKVVMIQGEKNKKIWKIEFDNSSSKLDDFDIHSYLLFKNFMPLPLVKSREATMEKIEKLYYQNFSKSKFEGFSLFAERQISSSHFYELLTLERYEKILEDCIWSIHNKREMELIEIGLDFTSISKNIEFPLTFLPVQLLYHRGVVHLSGFVKDSQKLIIIALEQLLDYCLTNNMFDNQILLEILAKKMKTRFGITANMNDEVYDIELEFSELTGSFVKSQFWHHNQEFVRLDNGNYLMTMNCGINRELVGWIFQWMSNVKVRKPDFLKNLVIEKHREILDSYKSDSPLLSNNSFIYS